MCKWFACGGRRIILICSMLIWFSAGIGEKGAFMAKQRKTLDERIQNCTTKEEEMLEKLKRYQAQRKQLERRKNDEGARCPVDIGSARTETEWRPENPHPPLNPDWRCGGICARQGCHGGGYSKAGCILEKAGGKRQVFFQSHAAFYCAKDIRGGR